VIKKHRWYLILLTKIKEYKRKSAANIVPDSIYKLLSALQQVIVLEIPITRDVILKVIGKSLVIRKWVNIWSYVTRCDIANKCSVLSFVELMSSGPLVL